MNAAIDKTDALMRTLDLEVYRVGGSVRDEIMGRPAKDADYMVRGVTLADLIGTLNRAKLACKPLVDRNGNRLGVRLAKGGVEITLPRKEVSTGPGRTDFDIVLDPGLGVAEDALRRDFTFNALYKHLASGEVGDPTAAGLYDLQHKLVRTTHPDSFRDDPLRILRALRFVATLGYDLATCAWDEMFEHAAAVDGLKSDGHVSGTVLDEFSRLLMGPDAAKALRIAARTGVLGAVFPELAPMIGFDQGSRYHDLTTDEHTFVALATAANVDAPLRVRWALLFHDAGKPATAWVGKDGRTHYYAQKPKDDLIDAFDGHVNLDHEEYGEILWRQAAERLNASRELREDVARLIRNHMVGCAAKIKRAKIARARIAFGDEFLSDLYLHRMCDLTGKGRANRQHMANVAAAEVVRREMAENKVPRQIRDLAVNGNDAANLGLNGKQIGDVLRTILDEVAVDPSAAKTGRDWQMMRLEALAA